MNVDYSDWEELEEETSEEVAKSKKKPKKQKKTWKEIEANEQIHNDRCGCPNIRCNFCRRAST